MNNKFIWLALVLLLRLPAFAQQTDSINVVHSRWEKTKIARKIKLFRHHFNKKDLFNANEQISYIEVKNRGKRPVFHVGFEEKELVTTSNFGLKNAAVAAINGTFFDVKNGGSVDFIKAEGKIITPNRLLADEKRARHQQAALVIQNGKLNIKQWDGEALWENKLPEANVMLTGPLLLLNQVNQELDTTAFTRLRNPRSCIGIKPNGKIVLLTVDGRNKNSAGMSLFELAKLMRWLGCTSAINLDGGGSTTLWSSKTGVINYPCDNKKWDHQGERKVANVILVKRR